MINVKSLLDIESDKRIKLINSLSDDEAEELFYMWEFWARDNQLEPYGNWLIWLVLAGRGFGKTRTGAEWIKKRVECGQAKRIALVAPTSADVRDVMIEGESGLLNIFPRSKKPLYEPSKRRITFYNGSIATAYSADEPERLRGPQHDTAWMDELCSFRYPSAYDMLMFGLRLGNPRAIITTTPKPSKLLKEIMSNKGTIVTRGSTYDNRNNLASNFFNLVIKKYEGTRLGRQELNAEILEDVEGALFNRTNIENNRVIEIPKLVRIVIGVDPAVSTNKESDETGIIIGGLGIDSHGYVLDDCTIKGSPSEWANNVVEAFYKWEADKIIAENNNGGDMVKFTIETVNKNVPIKLIHASRGKQTRAEPISALYEQNMIHHVGVLGKLEDQICNWLPSDSDSPDRMDALVWCLWELMINGNKSYKKVRPSGVGMESIWKI